MTKAILASLVLLAISASSASLFAQDSFDGRWQTEAQGRLGADIVTFEFKTNGTALTGSLRRTQPASIVNLEGKIDKDLVVFVVKASAKTITFLGKLDGDQIVFTREARGVAAPGDGPGTGILGMNGPKNLVATRIKSPAAPPLSSSATMGDLGTWQIQFPGSNGANTVAMDFRTDGTKLTGTIRRISPCCFESAALEGIVSRDLMMFSIQNGGQTITLMGKITGDEIAFTRETTGTAASSGQGASIFSANVPSALTAKRVR
jgi:hypothetical protein